MWGSLSSFFDKKKSNSLFINQTSNTISGKSGNKFATAKEAGLFDDNKGALSGKKANNLDASLIGGITTAATNIFGQVAKGIAGSTSKTETISSNQNVGESDSSFKKRVVQGAFSDKSIAGIAGAAGGIAEAGAGIFNTLVKDQKSAAGTSTRGRVGAVVGGAVGLVETGKSIADAAKGGNALDATQGIMHGVGSTIKGASAFAPPGISAAMKGIGAIFQLGSSIVGMVSGANKVKKEGKREGFDRYSQESLGGLRPIGEIQGENTGESQVSEQSPGVGAIIGGTLDELGNLTRVSQNPELNQTSGYIGVDEEADKKKKRLKDV